jgi:FtsP/CotA-like multicopper oxidase with cupredoxin domain
MAGLFLVSDDDEKKLNLPTGAYDVPLVIQDRMFNNDNQLIYLPGGMMDQVNGMLGDTILINGRPDYTLDVATRIYRLRLLNGSNARAYNLAWSDSTPITILGTDGGLLTKPWVLPSVMLGPGERLDIWADFSKHRVGDQIGLLSQPFDDGASQMMPGRRGRGMMGDYPVLPDGAALNLMTVRVVERAAESKALPLRLSKDSGLNPNDALNIGNPREFELGMFHMHGLINGRTFQMKCLPMQEIFLLSPPTS